MLSRKRRRSQAFADATELVDLVSSGDDDNEDDDQQDSSDRLEKEREVWDAFREEHFEAVEQMPLTLHRQFSLMRELDQQAHGYTADLLPMLHKYIAQRRSMAALQEPATKPTEEFSGSNEDASAEEARPPSPSAVPSLGKPSFLQLEHIDAMISGKQQPSSTSTPQTPTPMGVPSERAKIPQTTREMLSHIAWLSEELFRASEEKVNLAQAAYDSVDRHIRILDQAIKEQESAISLGTRPGHPSLMLLPDLVVPRWGRPSRATLSPLSDTRDDLNLDQADRDDGITHSVVFDDAGQSHIPSQRGRTRKGAGRGKAKGKNSDDHGLTDVPIPAMKSLKITLPPVTLATVTREVEVGQERYCYCNKLNFGEMIGCDNASCELEWFHLACLGLTEPPKGKWYCPDCTANRRSKRK